MPSKHDNDLADIFRRLERHYGPTGWWPGDSPFEVAVGAILTQNTAWVNVEKAIANLKAADWLCPQALLEVPEERLHEALRPAGYFRVKARRLRNFCQFLVENHAGSMEALARVPLERLRHELLAINGIGPETADCILLYACGKPVFVIDAYTRRVLGRHGYAEASAPYEELRRWFEEGLARDAALWKEFHGLLVFVGKDFCRARARCDGCPLEALLRGGRPLAWPRDQ